ncbi:MAG: adenosylcobinamide-phosphate synthase CbiB [Candidatus Melainabacteria bacterium]|nr:adenosylcobinamide-phosphate synthase CbiB [Candidatus Melainabacteria bacterium]
MALVALRLVKMPLAVLVDDILGEPAIFHPLAGFGQLAQLSENFFHTGYSPGYRKELTNLFGTLALTIIVAPPIILANSLVKMPLAGPLLDLALLYLSIAPRSLRKHAEDVYKAMRQGDMELARKMVARIVSRDTAALSQRDLAAATVESVLENGNDAVFAALFWYYIGGGPAALCYRLINTLDAMWGYKNERYQDFGWAAARLDDLLNFLPARLTALSFAIMGDSDTALYCWRKQGHHWYSPNAGPVMAAGAGALQLKLGGDAIYGGKIKSRPSLGLGKEVEAEDIPRAVKLIENSLQLWSIISIVGVIWKMTSKSLFQRRGKSLPFVSKR